MDAYRQRVTIDVIWTREPGKDPKIDWNRELSQALNEADEYQGTLWSMEVGPLEKLEGGNFVQAEER
jgi:hypothetical protein